MYPQRVKALKSVFTCELLSSNKKIESLLVVKDFGELNAHDARSLLELSTSVAIYQSRILLVYHCW